MSWLCPSLCKVCVVACTKNSSLLKEHFTFADYFAYFFCLRDKLAEFESNSDPQQCTFRYGNNIKVHRAYSGFLRSMAGMNADFTNHLELKAFITDYKGDMI